ncbi:succinylglutamate desuccinylase/aspartoacylase family protein [Rhizobium sp. KVB221]|uniref:Succinylglutamate desuccinylase/aspartoacylase family protein n=1 Tax=Rhizobium setariae TaxID=2801340 RepID=A0A937CNC6_9HYPH|nr:succinylglutamate desuccinylase/aspartoacylase family protein [Rhizobium setariae]MBL0371033.1 succinylglutamate desuccinylase/aspartoacylase family protein [Rhizobium setariae]
MDKTEIVIAGDTPGAEWRIPVLKVVGKDPKAPKVYMQAALHAGELPGVAALHFLVPMLQTAEAKGEILGDITIVPRANPIGAAQWINGEMEGRFDLASRANFNRDYPHVGLEARESLLSDLENLSTVDQLKRHLLHMATGSDLMLDLHCDDESQLYTYVHEAYWPQATDLAESMGLEAVLLSDGNSSAFEDSVTYAWEHGPLGNRKHWAEGRISITMEFRGTADVDPVLGRMDAEGLYAFLQRRGAIAGAPIRREEFDGPVAGLDFVQMVNSPAAGMVLFEREYGETVEKGDLLATIVTTPGDVSGDRQVLSPTDGTIVTRVGRRFLRRGDNLMKIASRELSGAKRKPGGGLED